jgi:hypothetical protein
MNKGSLTCSVLAPVIVMKSLVSASWSAPLSILLLLEYLDVGGAVVRHRVCWILGVVKTDEVEKFKDVKVMVCIGSRYSKGQSAHLQ